MTQAVYLVDQGNTKIAGKESTFEAVWQTVGFTTNAARKSAIQSHASYLPFVTADGYLLDYQEWNYTRQAKTNVVVTISYSHQASSRNKNQNQVLQNAGDEETRISFSSVEVPVTEAISQTKYGDSPDCGNSIDYNTQTQEVKGTTRKVAVSRLQVTKIYSAATVTNSWIKTREDKLFTLNSTTFRSRPAETVMFVGMEMSQRSLNGDWTVTFVFEYMPKETKDLADLDINATGDIDIFPYRYYWALYEEEKDATANMMVPRAKGFYESKIYRVSDFNSNLI